MCRLADAAAEADCAKRIVSAVARRAFRRAVTDADIDAPLRFYKEARTDGDFDDGIEMAIRAVLASTEFLFDRTRSRERSAASPYRVSDVELASRLSFFLWSSVPDDELWTWRLQARSADRRCWSGRSSGCWRPQAEFVTNFAGQWL